MGWLVGRKGGSSLMDSLQDGPLPVTSVESPRTLSYTTSVPTTAAPPAPVADMHWQQYHVIAPAPEEETPLPVA